MSSIKTCLANRSVISELTIKFGFKAENHIARLAIAYSLACREKLDLSKILDKDGKEYDARTLFGKYEIIYRALLSRHYQINLNDTEFLNYIKLHLDSGLILIKNHFESHKSEKAHDFLKNQILKGIENFEDYSELEDEYQSNGSFHTEWYSDLIKLQVGTVRNTLTPVYFELNNIKLHSNAHIAIAGKSGTGKTSLAYSLLAQITEQSKDKIKFIFFDYKGFNEKLPSKDQSTFLDKTHAKVITLPETCIPINPLSIIDLHNEKKLKSGIQQFVDNLSAIQNLGTQQRNELKRAIEQAIDDKERKSHPTLQDVAEKLRENYDKSDSLTSLLDNLCEVNLFAEQTSIEDIFKQNIYLNLSPELSNNIRISSILLTMRVLYVSLMGMRDSGLDSTEQYKGIRYVILIDEAHQVFKQKKAQDILDQFLRMVRSKGVSLILVSQSISDFIADTEFSDNCSNAFLLDISDKKTKSIQRFMGLSDNYTSILNDSLGKIESFQAISNIKEYTIGKLFDVIRFS
jgi:DNA sulfur modification protein DndE